MYTSNIRTSRVRAAASRLYDAECALHAAHQSGVDAWIAAASAKLHDAVVTHSIAVAEQRSAAGRAPRRLRTARRPTPTGRPAERRHCTPSRTALSPRMAR
jgi:hypothetical protein